MSIQFQSPSYRAASSDLTIQISPLGLVELADEEFEVHGPRLNRYSMNWAFYLGYHWAQRPDLGDPQLTFNYVRALSDFTTNFVFGKGVGFRSPDSTGAIVPTRLQRVWEVDNKKESLLWEAGSMGSVTGDCFIKVAYEEPWQDPTGMPHPGRVRILPMNSAFCFPEWHPHDRKRLIRFKLKYRFWGCLRPEVEALTRRGWKHHGDITADDELLTIDPATDEVRWSSHQGIHVYDYDGDMVEWSGRINTSATPNHRWLAELPSGERRTVRGEFVHDTPGNTRLVLGGGTPLEFQSEPKWSDELVESVAWYVCDGSDHTNRQGYQSIHLAGKRPHKVAAWRRLAAWWTAEGGTWREGKTRANGQSTFYLGKGAVDALHEAAPGKAITPEFLCSLTYSQATLFRWTLLIADGYERRNSTRWTQLDEGRRDGYQMLCAMLGIRTGLEASGEKVQEYVSRYYGTRYLHEKRVPYQGKVWCPTVPTGYFMARSGGTTYWTGNTTQEGTRQVFTYTELLTESSIEEYVNDELIDQRENPLGEIPIVHISNMPIAGSPWGMPDIQDITVLNRQYNETCTDIADIVSYHAAPVTVVIGARASNLEKGTHQTWSIPNKDAKVENLLFDPRGIEEAIKLLDVLKQGMHEMTGVPKTTLGEEQAISNTSGVALAIQYQPLMNRFHLKATQYGEGYQEVNRLALKTLFMKEPEMLVYNPEIDPPLRDDQLPMLDPMDPVTYANTVHFQPPLPVDKLVLLNELQVKMALGLESKRGALEELGEEFPDEKLQELFKELIDDAEQQATLDLLRSQIAGFTVMQTGMVPPDGPQPMPPPPANGNGDGKSNGNGGGVKSAGGPNVSVAPGAKPPSGVLPGIDLTNSGDVKKMFDRVVALSHGTVIPQRRTPEEDEGA